MPVFPLVLFEAWVAGIIMDGYGWTAKCGKSFNGPPTWLGYDYTYISHLYPYI